MKTDKSLSGLIEISNAVGKDKTLVQGGGGNTSIKTDDGKYMHIKASGTALRDMCLLKGWRRVKLSAVMSIFDDLKLAAMEIDERESEMVRRLLDACDDNVQSNVRPSVEAPLHAVLGKCVIHLHALAVLAYVCANKGREFIEKLFSSEKLPTLWVPYANPGYSLGLRVRELVLDYQKRYGQMPSIIFMEKHGVIISAEDEQKGLQLVKKVMDTCCSMLERPPFKQNSRLNLMKEHTDIRALVEKALFELTGQDYQLNQFIDDDIIDFCQREDAEKLLKAPPLTPDEKGFVENIIWLDSDNYSSVKSRLGSVIREHNKVPSAFIVKGGGLLIKGSNKMSLVIRDIVAGSLFIRREAQNFGGINPLNQEQLNFIANWEAEKFRVKLTESNKI